MSVVGAIIVPHPAVLIPEVGGGREREVSDTIASYEEASSRLAAWKPETVVVLSPHSVLYADYFHISPGKEAQGDLSRFGADGLSMTVQYDEELAKEIEYEGVEGDIPLGSLGEQDARLDHGTYVPLYFINKHLREYKVVRMSVSGLSPLTHYRLGQCISRAAEVLGRRVAVVASGDLSHCLKDDGPYSYAKEGPLFDQQVTKAMAQGDFMEFLRFKETFLEKAGECGLRSFIVMSGALDRKKIKPELLSYEGPFGVGYGVAVFEVEGDAPDRNFGDLYEESRKLEIEEMREKEDPYIRLARLSLDTFVRERTDLKLPSDIPKEMREQRAGVFVSLKKDGKLRGCIGTIQPVQDSIALEIAKNAVSAGVSDLRFEPVQEEELADLVYSVDVLAESEPVHSLKELDPARYGVIVTKGRKRGLLLPNLDGVDTVDEQISIALQKAGISPEEDYSIERFEVIRHKV